MLHALDILRTLIRHEVEFVVIGGYSLAAHGVVRGTKDIDIFPAPRLANLRRLLTALEEMDAEAPKTSASGSCPSGSISAGSRAAATGCSTPATAASM